MFIIACTNLLGYFKHWYLKVHLEEISELKFFKLLVSMKRELKAIIKKKNFVIAHFLDQLADIVERTCVKEQKKNKMKPLSILRNLS